MTPIWFMSNRRLPRRIPLTSSLNCDDAIITGFLNSIEPTNASENVSTGTSEPALSVEVKTNVTFGLLYLPEIEIFFSTSMRTVMESYVSEENETSDAFLIVISFVTALKETFWYIPK